MHKNASKPPLRQDVNLTDLQEILARVKNSGALDESSYGKLSGAVDTLALLTAELEKSHASVKALRRWLFGPSSETTRKVLNQKPNSPASADWPKPEDKDSTGAGAEPAAKEPIKGHGRNGADAYTGARKIAVPHPTLKRGVCCPGCQRGKVYPMEKAARLVRIHGMAPLVATVFQREQLRCNACQEVFTAPPPPGVGEEKYDASAVAMLGLLHYATGLPFNRLEKVQANMGIPVPAATQWDLVKAGAEKLTPAFDELVDQAAQSQVVHNDDTHMPVIQLMNPETRPKDETIDEGRTGMFTSGIVAERSDGRRVSLFFTGPKHAGENLNAVLSQRRRQLPLIIQVCDALSRNAPRDVATLLGNCNTHARRGFVNELDNFPEECGHVIEAFRVLYLNDAQARDLKLDAQARLLHHQQHSSALMGDLHAWLKKKQEDKAFEPNSGMGKAVAYMLKHWEPLTLFLRVPSVPLDNNICERALKKAIMHRKNSLFYRTMNGARVGDIYMSLIHTAELVGADPFHYLTSLLTHHEALQENPSAWLPWNYKEALPVPADRNGAAG